MRRKGKVYQYTAIDEYFRWRYVEVCEEYSTYSYTQFLEHLIRRFPMPIFSTSGKETLTLFQHRLNGIRHKLIPPLHHIITEEWNAATARIMNGFMPRIFSIPLRFFLSSFKPITVEIITSFP